MTFVKLEYTKTTIGLDRIQLLHIDDAGTRVLLGYSWKLRELICYSSFLDITWLDERMQGWMLRTFTTINMFSVFCWNFWQAKEIVLLLQNQLYNDDHMIYYLLRSRHFNHCVPIYGFNSLGGKFSHLYKIQRIVILYNFINSIYLDKCSDHSTVLCRHDHTFTLKARCVLLTSILRKKIALYYAHSGNGMATYRHMLVIYSSLKYYTTYANILLRVYHTSQPSQKVNWLLMVNNSLISCSRSYVTDYTTYSLFCRCGRFGFINALSIGAW